MVPIEHRELILNDVSWLHDSRFQDEFDFRLNIVINRWYSLELKKFVDYFMQQWLRPQLNTWQLFRRPFGFPTIAINESFNKQFKETWTKYKTSNLLDLFENTLPSLCKYYSDHPIKYADYPDTMNLKKEIVSKANKLNAQQFERYDFNYLVFNGLAKSTGEKYQLYIYIYGNQRFVAVLLFWT